MAVTTSEVFLFGAGASHGARTPRPPLGRTLHQYVLQYLLNAWSDLNGLEEGDGIRTTDVRQNLQQILGSAVSFECLVTELQAAGQDETLEKLSRLMAYTLTPPINDDYKVDDAFVEMADVYDQFLSWRFSNGEGLESTTFLSLNYDCLLERAVCRVKFGPEPDEVMCKCKHINYHLRNDGSGIDVLKPHGSINWVGDPLVGNGRIPDGGTVPLVARYSGGVFEYTNINLVSTAKDEPGEIIVAHYAPGKKAQANPGTLLKIRKIAKERVETATTVTIIGVHVPTRPSEDPFLSELMQLMGRRKQQESCSITYVSPDEDEVRRAQGLGFATVPKKFEEYVNERG